jgi:hypothetical protein
MEDSKTYKILIDKRKDFIEIYRQVGLAPSERLASPAKAPYCHLARTPKCTLRHPTIFRNYVLSTTVIKHVNVLNVNIPIH